jgi:hypothetical protein
MQVHTGNSRGLGAYEKGRIDIDNDTTHWVSACIISDYLWMLAVVLLYGYLRGAVRCYTRRALRWSTHPVITPPPAIAASHILSLA